MTTRERPVDRGRRRGRELYLRVARELRAARVDRGLSLAAIGSAIGLSASEVSRIERGLLPGVSVLRLAELEAVVGLELDIRVYPGGQPLRDAAQVDLLERFRRRLHRSWRWAVEVPLPIVGDLRAWGAMAWLPDRRYGVEVETRPSDAQALMRRLQLKRRDGGVDGVLLVLPDTRTARAFVRAAEPTLREFFPIPGRRALELIRAGADPGGSAVVTIPR
jgi:transcriptional regulator with XRE-family HTH domain